MDRTHQGLAWRCGDFVNTDVIAPGRFEPYPDDDALARAALIDYPTEHPFVDPTTGRSRYSVIFAGAEMGCGSSRETAPMALRAAGARVIVAPSFARIFYRNCINMGLIVPIVLDHGLDDAVIGAPVEVDFERRVLRVAGQAFSFPDFGAVRDIVAHGGLAAYTRSRMDSPLPKVSTDAPAQAPAPQSMTEKILARAAGVDRARPGEVIEAELDLVFAHDAVAYTLKRWFHREFGADARVWDPDRVALFQDHLVPAKDAASQALARALASFAEEQGISKRFLYGRDYGISHVVLCERGMVQPGTLTIGADSHAVTYGALNAIGVGVGLVDVMCALYTGRLWLRVPRTIGVQIDGALPPGVMAKDIILKLVGDLGQAGASACAVEFFGTTVDAMSVQERMTLCNMTVEAGATNAVMPMSERVRDHLGACGASTQRAVTTDPGYRYHRQLHYRAESLEPMVARPHAPDNVVPARDLSTSRVAVQQVYVGSCAGGKEEDIAALARELEGRRIADGLRLIVVPASTRVYRALLDAGWIAALLDAGAVVESPGCKACYGAHGGVLGDGEVCLSTTNRNYRGRMGNPRSEVYLCSPIVAARSAVAGYITAEEVRRG
ncbi:MAG: 3-isopropylmalate dehydratase large subunit [Alphaproteobacteria bacterium]|nr:3-isopropylmalate dehydratase large subunit [Alphaproteobacteria bacterium]